MKSPSRIRSAAIGEADLIRIASQWSQAHLNAIASRSTLSEHVTDVLVERGDDRVATTVVENRGARFSRNGFFTLADQAATNKALLRRLAARVDLPEEITERLLPYITASLQSKLEAAGADVDDSILDELAERSRAMLADRLRAAAGLGRSLDVLMDHIACGLMNLDEAITELADADAAPEVAKLLADRIDLRVDTIIRALCAPAEGPPTLVCRAAGLRMNGYSAIVRMRRRRRRGSEGSPAEILERYRRMPLEPAQRLVRFLKVRETAETIA
jgi:Uncharacterised protein conserved in bacteria (DUF2336)